VSNLKRLPLYIKVNIEFSIKTNFVESMGIPFAEHPVYIRFRVYLL